MERGVRNRRKTKIGSAVLIGFITVSSPLLYFAIKDYFYRLPFDAQQWQQADTTAKDSVRFRMIDHLLQQHNLKGMSRDEVIKLLGKPGSERNLEMSYYLGPERSWISIDSEALDIQLNSDQKVISYAVTTH